MWSCRRPFAVLVLGVAAVRTASATSTPPPCPEITGIDGVAKCNGESSFSIFGANFGTGDVFSLCGVDSLALPSSFSPTIVTRRFSAVGVCGGTECELSVRNEGNACTAPPSTAYTTTVSSGCVPCPTPDPCPPLDPVPQPNLLPEAGDVCLDLSDSGYNNGGVILGDPAAPIQWASGAGLYLDTENRINVNTDLVVRGMDLVAEIRTLREQVAALTAAAAA